MIAFRSISPAYSPSPFSSLITRPSRGRRPAAAGIAVSRPAESPTGAFACAPGFALVFLLVFALLSFPPGAQAQPDTDEASADKTIEAVLDAEIQTKPADAAASGDQPENAPVNDDAATGAADRKTRKADTDKDKGDDDSDNTDIKTDTTPRRVKELIGKEARVYTKGDALTMDFNPDRINIELSKEGKILRVWQG